jgi:hypothetical protein
MVNGPIIWRIVIWGAQPPFKKKGKKKDNFER